MNKELIDYVQNSESDINNFNLAVWYENQGYLSPACSYYLRCAELTKDELLAYECLLSLYVCYKKLSNRDHTCESVIKNAINLCPNRPEAYFLLSQFYENKKNWIDSYLYASLGLNLSNCHPSGLKKNYGYESKYMLIFQKAVSSWWVGKPDEARSLLRLLKDEYKDKMNDFYLNLVQKNLTNLGAGPEEKICVKYNKETNTLRFKFKGYENISKNFSQAGQDLFVLAALDGKTNGTYLEIGAAHPHHNSNTALLEILGWKGIGIEFKKELADMHHKERKNKCINTDALKLDYEKLLDENFDSKIIDYLQLDIEPSKNTFEALISIPFHKYKFRAITYEHDHYVDTTGLYRNKSRIYLKNMGYSLLFNDIAAVEGCNFEDWWVREDLLEKSILSKMLSYVKKDINLVKEIIFEK